MNCTDCTARLHDYVDGELTASDVHTVETHLRTCANCRAQHEALRKLLATVAALPPEIAPERDLWRELRTEIEQPAVPAHQRSAAERGLTPPSIPRMVVIRWCVPLAIAASIALLAILLERSIASRGRDSAWSVATVAGAPRVGTRLVRHEAAFRVGQWLETDAASRAKVAVGRIGEVSVGPNSRLRLIDTESTNHRLELERGTLRALIWAPPRLFFVNTPSATAVDLGCAYTLAVDEDGNGELHVTSGYVALEDDARESIIRMGMMCLTRRGAGPGTPFASDAPEALRAALTRFDFERDTRPAALSAILALARADDAITLWHLLARTEHAERADVFDTLAKIAPPPAGVTRDGILAGDVAMRRMWAEHLGLATFAAR